MAKKRAADASSTSKKVAKSNSKLSGEYKNEKKKLNDMFKSLKGQPTTAVPARTTTKAPKSDAKKTSSSSSRSRKDEVYAQVPVSGTARRRTEDNLPVYTIEELNIGKGGDTDLCPFDCTCYTGCSVLRIANVQHFLGSPFDASAEVSFTISQLKHPIRNVLRTLVNWLHVCSPFAEGLQAHGHQ
ncbi:hypothetical protein, conserved [Babesia ovata]|uniref:Uncharacterized protein n=1 Tax=Babesia ovata TaxID=189622 RepID=A0A2H6K9U0_9APIC|nr:uncharacterized protein BOVATA_012650 [Babesia ovata]GBE59772.1 hypothetical protein, conserved [Babesia ovata]